MCVTSVLVNGPRVSIRMYDSFHTASESKVDTQHTMLLRPGCMQMPTGTGKTITLLSLITSYQLEHPEVGQQPYLTLLAPAKQSSLSQVAADRVLLWP